MEALYKLRLCLRTLRAFLRTECLRLCGTARFRRSGASACSPRPHVGERFLCRVHDCVLRVDLFSTVRLGSVGDLEGGHDIEVRLDGVPVGLVTVDHVDTRCCSPLHRAAAATPTPTRAERSRQLSLPALPTGTVGLRCQGPGRALLDLDLPSEHLSFILRLKCGRPPCGVPGGSRPVHQQVELKTPYVYHSLIFTLRWLQGRHLAAVGLVPPDWTPGVLRSASPRRGPTSGAHGLQIEVA